MDFIKGKIFSHENKTYTAQTKSKNYTAVITEWKMKQEIGFFSTKEENNISLSTIPKVLGVLWLN